RSRAGSTTCGSRPRTAATTGSAHSSAASSMPRCSPPSRPALSSAISITSRPGRTRSASRSGTASVRRATGISGRAATARRSPPTPCSSIRSPCPGSCTTASPAHRARCHRSATRGHPRSSTPLPSTSGRTFTSPRRPERRVAARSEAAYPVGWKNGRVASWLVTVDHKRIGILYIATSLVWFVAAGILALLMRSQLATPGETFLTKNSYNEVLTMHGTTMIFLVVVPIVAGFANFLVPLMIGASDMAFPRLNALSYWLYLLGGIVLWLSWFAKGGAAHSGWWSYPTLSEKFPWASPGHGQDYWILSLHILTISSLLGAINFIVTIVNMRAPGMTWMRMPLFIWAIVTYAILLLLALPALSAAITLLLLDRTVGTHFFIPSQGGSLVLYQHMFWFFGHPEVYIMVLPV